jgi:hypothetical protein
MKSKSAPATTLCATATGSGLRRGEGGAEGVHSVDKVVVVVEDAGVVLVQQIFRGFA